ncbi:hypothetical protein HAX54_052991 [Datura stramonium]|uniref:Uncharacterized protein n=1 Tax=Datura stramonium TaxID=4076 RepID=A0ABS8T0D9_DATST|nr:hypothetical protein [Datura stramonium]
MPACFIASCIRMEEGGGTLCRRHTERQVAASRATRASGREADRMASQGLWCRHVCVPFNVQAGLTRLNAGSLPLFLELTVKRGLGQPPVSEPLVSLDVISQVASL